jgi:hypothetical protein
MNSLIKDEPLEFPAPERKRSYGAAFEYGSPKVRRALGAGIRPLSAIVATTGLYDLSLMPSYTGNSCPEENETEDKEIEDNINNGGTPKLSSPVMPPTFKTSNEIAQAMNIAFAKAGLLGQAQQSGSSSGPGTYLGLMQTHAAESVRSAGSLPSGKYPPATYHYALLNASVSGSKSKQPAQTINVHNPMGAATGEMVVVGKAGPSKKLITSSKAASSSSSESKAKRMRKSGETPSSGIHENFMALDKLMNNEEHANPTRSTVASPDSKKNPAPSDSCPTQ